MGIGFDNPKVTKIIKIIVPKGSPLHKLAEDERKLFAETVVQVLIPVLDMFLGGYWPEGSQDGLEGQSS